MYQGQTLVSLYTPELTIYVLLLCRSNISSLIPWPLALVYVCAFVFMYCGRARPMGLVCPRVWCAHVRVWCARGSGVPTYGSGVPTGLVCPLVLAVGPRLLNVCFTAAGPSMGVFPMWFCVGRVGPQFITAVRAGHGWPCGPVLKRLGLKPTISLQKMCRFALYEKVRYLGIWHHPFSVWSKNKCCIWLRQRDNNIIIVWVIILVYECNYNL